MSREPVVHVIDDDDGARDSLQFLLQTARLQVRAYESPEAFLNELPQATEGCVVTDVRMPGMTGLELLQRLRELQFPLSVIVITGHGDVPLAVESMKLGAVDFLEKPFSEEAMLAAVRRAIAPRAGADAGSAESLQFQDRLAALSPRERQVLDGVVAGHSNKQIAADLGISPRTIEIYRANVMTKMQASSLSDLVRMTLLQAGPRAKPV